jgi:hypothetical protein
MYTVKLRGGRTAVRIALAGLVVTLAGCQVLNTERAARKHEPSGLLVGRITTAAQIQGPFIVEALDRAQGKIAHRAFVEQAGRFEMRIGPGAYKFIAYADRNRDGRFERSEPVSVRMSLDSPIRAGDVLMLPALDIRVQALERQ